MDAKRVNKEYSNAEAVDIIHQVANLYISTKVPRDYGTGEEYTSVEVHTLKHIADNPGITVTEGERALKLGAGGVICFANDLLPIDARNWYIPAGLL